MRLPKVPRSRRIVQWVATAIVAAMGVQFTLWVTAHLAGRWPAVPRPAGVDAFLPIDAMLGLRHLLHTGVVDAVHPAGVGIFLGICLMSFLVARSFCSHLCPVGLLSELAGRLGQKLFGRNLRLPRWLDVPLRGLKFLLLAFFVWAVWFAMTPAGVEAFLGSPYAKVADVKMWQFFAAPSRTTIVVVAVLLLGSVLIRDLWCRYLCPYGALLGVLGRFAPFKVTRDASACIDCRKCTNACPAGLAVHLRGRVSSIECTACQSCVLACPITDCLTIAPPKPVPVPVSWRRPATVVAAAVVAYALVVGGFRLAGHWHPDTSEAEYRFRIGEIDSPLYHHSGGEVRQDPRTTVPSAPSSPVERTAAR